MAISIELADSYLKAGLSVLPAIKAKKRPAVGSWKTWAERLPTEIEVEAWFSNNYDGVCVIAGAVSGHLECVDFDCGGEAYPAWAAKVDPEILSKLVVEKTPSGGKHVVYRCAEPVEGNQKLAQGIRNGKLATLVETRSTGGLFLCAPTPGYVLEQHTFPEVPVISKEARDGLLQAARELDEETSAPTAPSERAGVSGATGAFLTRPGDDFASRGDMRPILTAHGWTFSGTKSDGNELWTRPGKDPRNGHSATLKDGVFFPFSSNAAPFEPGKGYNAYQVLTILDFGSDFTASAKWLLDNGYGQKEPEINDVDISCFLDGNTQSALSWPDEEDEPAVEYADPGPIPEEYYSVPGFVSELMSYTMRTAHYPNKPLAFAGAFAMLAHLGGRKFKDEYGTRPNVYILSLAASGTGKQHPRSVNASLAALKGFASEIGDYFASGEGLEDSLLSSPTMLFQIDEADTLFNTVKMKDARAEMINSMLLRLYSESSSVHVMRKKALQRGAPATASSIIQPHLTFLGTAVPKFLYSALSERVLENGLLARCLVLEAGPRGDANPDPLEEDFPERVINDITEIIRIGHEDALFNEFPQPRTIPMDLKAKARIKEVRAEADAMYKEFEGKNSECGMALWARAAEKVAKFAIVYALSQSVTAPVIRTEAIDWARGIIFHATKRMLYQAGLYVFDNEFDQTMKRVIQKITVKGGGRMTYRQLLRSISMEKDELKRVLNTMVARGNIHVEQGPRGGDVFVLS